MAEPFLTFLKRLGLSPASLIAGVAFAGAWYQTISPIPAEMAKLNDNVQRLGTKVEIHSVLIGQLAEIKTEVTAMRKELSTVEGRLAHMKNFSTP
jgi:hypothetical protein